MLFRPIILFVFLLGLGACAVPTPYGPAGDGFGYSEQQIEDNRYRVSFAGNALTARETVENYLIFRAAEVTVDQGYDHFIVVDEDIERSTRYENRGYYDDPFPYYEDDFDRRRRFGPRFVTSTSSPIDEYAGSVDVLLFEGDKPGDDINAYDAKDVLLQLQNVIIRPTS